MGESFDFNTLFATEQLGFAATICLLVMWELVWKGIALWRAAKNHHKVWFVFILILNTVGVLPIVYLLLNKMRKG
jgi:hypothetical protein